MVLEHDFPELMDLLNYRAAMAFNPHITMAQCEELFRVIQLRTSSWRETMLSKQWLSGNDRECANLKQQHSEKIKIVMQESGALLWHNNENDLTHLINHRLDREDRASRCSA